MVALGVDASHLIAVHYTTQMTALHALDLDLAFYWVTKQQISRMINPLERPLSTLTYNGPQPESISAFDPKTDFCTGHDVSKVAPHPARFCHSAADRDGTIRRSACCID